MEQAIKNVLEGLHAGFTAEADTRNPSWLGTVLTEFSHLDLSNPEEFGLVVSMTCEDQSDLLARTVLSDVTTLDPNQKWKLEFTYTNYSFIEHQLDRVIETFNGSACSADRTRFLIDTYVSYLKTGALPEVNRKDYWIPSAGELIDWMNWIDTMPDLYYGKFDNFAEKRSVIVNAYKTRNEAILGALSAVYVASAHFKSVSHSEDNKIRYTFIHEESGDTGIIALSENTEQSFRLNLQAQDKTWRYGDDMPQWFDELLNARREM